jgi:hypothetical protein
MAYPVTPVAGIRWKHPRREGAEGASAPRPAARQFGTEQAAATTCATPAPTARCRTTSRLDEGALNARLPPRPVRSPPVATQPRLVSPTRRPRAARPTIPQARWPAAPRRRAGPVRPGRPAGFAGRPARARPGARPAGPGLLSDPPTAGGSSVVLHRRPQLHHRAQAEGARHPPPPRPWRPAHPLPAREGQGRLGVADANSQPRPHG